MNFILVTTKDYLINDYIFMTTNVQTTQTVAPVKKRIYPVDEQCAYAGGEILIKGDDAYTCTLNQTDIVSNKNKFYIIQVVKDGGKYHYFTKYGRVGESGKTSTDSFTNEDGAINAFIKQFKSKTGNNWYARDKFVKKAGKYFMSEVVYETEADLPDPNVDKSLQVVSKLDTRLQYLMSLLSDVETMNKALYKLSFDTKKVPLGKLSNSQLEKAQAVLDKISDYLKLNATISDEDIELADLSSLYYTYVPTSTGGRRKPPIISTKDMVSSNSDKITELKDIVVAVNVMENAAKDVSEHPHDNIYKTMKTTIKPIDRSSDTWKALETYINSTHGSTHYYKKEILDMFEIEREGEKNTYDNYTKNIGNKHLLFHGSRMCNFISIMSKGLLLNPSSLGVYIAGKILLANVK